MTLEEAIEFYEFCANAHERDAEYHRPLGYSHETIANVAEMQAREERQFAEWLKELKAYRETYPYGVDRFNGSDTPQSCFSCDHYEPKGWCNLFEDTVSPNYKCCSEFAEIKPYEYEIKALHKDYQEPYCEVADTPQNERSE